MKQLIQYLNTGETKLEEVPVPAIQPGHILIQSACSLVSAGTEKMLVEFSKSSLLAKARKNPERVAQVIDKIKTDGLLPTLEAVFKKLDEPLPLGYCNSGIVVEVAHDVHEFKVGDRVASNGMHAEFVCVPKNLAAKIPDTVSNEEAAFTVIGSVGLQAIRLVQPQIGETVVVIGLGLIGMITCQILMANGCRVFGFDIDENKITIARSMQIEAFHSLQNNIVQLVENKTNANGADAVIITASARNDSIINTAATISRKKGRIVLVGVIDLNIDRGAFYQKELSFQVSCSYGPGRYDSNYEEMGIDYPLPYVRWTEKRNFETILNCIEKKQLHLSPLITKNIEFLNAVKAYESISSSENIATILTYSRQVNIQRNIDFGTAQSDANNSVAVIGAGNFSKMTLLPALQHIHANIKYISSSNGLHAALLAKKYNIPSAISDNNIALNDPDIGLVFISTRHNSHAELAIQALESAKHVFVEKPMALNENELKNIENAVQQHPHSYLFVGFNRRYSPFSIKAKSLIENPAELNIVMTINAGKLPHDHWLQNETEGGGRIIGEACHFFDLMSYFTESKIESVFASDTGQNNKVENAIIQLNYKNGAHGVINYFANGNKAYPKEKIEIFSGNAVLVIDNFRKLSGFGTRNFNSLAQKQNKGHEEQFRAILHTIKTGGKAPISFTSLFNTTMATFAAMQSIREKRLIELN